METTDDRAVQLLLLDQDKDIAFFRGEMMKVVVGNLYYFCG